ncbi:MAG TPA: response regulator transcription factor [Pseudobacteroides sp.]|uniref:response regulator transcription factor n=1 Tax=Pseudobacteroides sp. TaxID=1968840 RepID=UPI002F95514B
MYRILIAENQPLVREGIKLILEQDSEIDVMGFASNGNDAFNIIKHNKVDLVLMDIVIDDCNGIEATEKIKKFDPSIKVLTLTSFCNEVDIIEIINAGADGCISKNMESLNLILAVKGTLSGLKIFHHDIYETLINNSIRLGYEINKSQKACLHKLTQNELDILKLIVEGKKNEDISEEICLSEGRVRNVITDLLLKFNVDNRTQLAVFAVKNKLI